MRLNLAKELVLEVKELKTVVASEVIVKELLVTGDSFDVTSQQTTTFVRVWIRDLPDKRQLQDVRLLFSGHF